jgi:ribosome-binding factor A
MRASEAPWVRLEFTGLPDGDACAQMSKGSKRQHGTRENGRGGGDSGGARASRLRELIREELNLLLRGEMRDPRLDDVEVTMVELARDGSCARVWFTAGAGDARASNDERIDALDRAAGFLRNHLAESLGLKRTPELRFRRDPATRTLAPDPPQVR